jgi:hypothetical protein
MSDHVTITRAKGAQLASFSTTSRQQSDMVFWQNQDSEAHFPAFPTGAPVLSSQVGPNANSGSVQPALALSTYYPSTGPSIPLPQGQVFPVGYVCSLHPGETGIINVYADFYSQPSQLAPFKRGTAATAPLTIGGMPNFTFTVSNSNLPASLTVTILVNTEGPVVTGTPGPNDAGSFAFDLYCLDSDGNNVTQTYLLTVS